MTFSLGKFLVAGALSLSSLAWATSAKTLLQSDLQSAVKSLPRETNFYHYFVLNTNFKNIEDTELREYQGRQQLIFDRLAKGGRIFRNFDNYPSGYIQAGPGLYLAMDPFASSPAAAVDTKRAFGDSIIEVKMRAGTRYLSTNNPISISRSTMSALIAEGYLTEVSSPRVLNDRKFTSETLKYMTSPGYEHFRKLVANLLLEMNINVVEYIWQSAAGPLCNGRDLRSAFVYISETRTADIVEANLIYLKGYPDQIVMTTSEEEALQRNQKLIPLLAKLRTIEKNSNSGGLFSKSRARKEANAEIDATYSPTELAKVKTSIFQCL